MGWLCCGGGQCSDNFGYDEKLIMMMNMIVNSLFSRKRKETQLRRKRGAVTCQWDGCAVGKDSDVITCISVIVTMRT